MKQFIIVFLASLVFSVAAARAEVRILAVRGDVQVRRGVGELWVAAAPGDVLKPEDSMKSGKKSSATLLVDEKQKISVPELVIIDCSDLRKLTQEQLLLMLAMEKVRSVQTQQRENDMSIPQTTTIHGENIGANAPQSAPRSKSGLLQLNGTKVLYDQGFYATCVLKAKEVFRLNPDLTSRIDSRMMVANALERMKLNGEALSEYLSLKKSRLTSEQMTLVQQKIATLRKKTAN